jgi:tripartite ATP-independent transporter DctP family solute receptor
MMRRKIGRATLRGAAVGLIGLGLVGWAGPAAAQATYNYRLGIVVSRAVLGGEFATTFIEAAKAMSNGRINIELFDRAQLGGETEMVANMRIGELDFAITGSGIVAAAEPTFSLTELPFIWKGADHVHRSLDGAIGHRMMSLLEPKGIKGLAFGEWGYRDLLIRTKPVNSPADVKGMKIRVIENPLYVTTWRTFGGSPVPMAWPEVYTGLQQGTIDAVDTNPIGMRDAKLYEVAKHLAVTHHIFTSIVLMMNIDKWKALPPDAQKIIVEAAKVGQKANRARATDANEQAIEFMKQQGVKATQPDLAPFREQAKAVYKRFEVQVGPDLIRQVLASQ